MSNYDSTGRLKISLGATGSTGASGVTVTNDGQTFTSITTLRFTGSHVVTNPTAGTVVITNNEPIIYLTGWNSSATPASRNLYSVGPGIFPFTGSTYFMAAALYRRILTDAAALVCGTANSYTGDGWGIWSAGYEFAETNVSARAANNQVNTQLGFPADNKWLLHVMYWDGGSPEIGQFINGSGPRVGSGDIPYPFFNGNFCIGAANTGSSNGNLSLEIAAVAIKTASFAADYANPVQHRFFEHVYAANDITQFSEIGFNHIWSVKQGSPGATWVDSVGGITLTITGTLALVTETVPRWA